MFFSTFCNGAFGPLLPEIARAHDLADWQLGVVAGAFGFARMAGAMPAGLLAGRSLATAFSLAPAVMIVGLLVLGTGGPFPVLVLGRGLMGLAHTLGMVSGLTAVLQDERSAGATVRLNTYEASGMLGILGGLALVGLLPQDWGWNVSLLGASSPLLLGVAVLPLLRRRLPEPPPARPRATAEGSDPAHPPAARTPPVVWFMLAVGMVFGFCWSSVSQFLIPLRGTREFGLERSGISRLLAMAQGVDLIVLLPVGQLADRLGRSRVLGAVALAMGLGALGAGLGSFPLFVAGCVGFGLGLAGWMLPLGVIREHAGREGLARRTGLYRLGVDATVFLGPVASGVLGAKASGVFVAGVGLAALAAGARLLWRPPTVPR
ncbi:MAG: MFS transporter [Candidatus Rokubacteria bacterium]|nr:MFS transporter [Candidatus Rokubacteria bacterium]